MTPSPTTATAAHGRPVAAWAVARPPRQRETSTGCTVRRPGPRVEQQILDLVVQAVDALDHRRDDIAVSPLGDAPVENLQRGAQAGERIAHLVGDHRGELAQLRQRRLFTKLGFGAASVR